MKILQRGGEQGPQAQLIDASGGGFGDPAGQLALQLCHLTQASHVRRRGDERADAGTAGRDAAQLQLAVGLHHRVRVDRERAGDVLDPRQLVAGPQVAKPQRVVHLVHELQVRRHARAPVQVERDRRDAAIIWFIGNHGKTIRLLAGDRQLLITGYLGAGDAAQQRHRRSDVGRGGDSGQGG